MSTVVSDRDVGSEEVALGSMGFWIIELTSPSQQTMVMPAYNYFGDTNFTVVWA